MSEITSEESLDRAMADVELLLSAYPDEAKAVPTNSSDDADDADDAPSAFPLQVQLKFSETACITLEWVQGYPVETTVQVHSYRSSNSRENARLHGAVQAVRAAAAEALADQIEAGFTVVAAAKETWDEQLQAEQSAQQQQASDTREGLDASDSARQKSTHPVYEWATGEPLTDRKSAFQAHVCRIKGEADVGAALSQLMDSNSKLHRATHNMVRTQNENISCVFDGFKVDTVLLVC